MSTTSSPGPIAIIGAGAVGTTLARAFNARGHRIEAVVSRDTEDARALADRVEAPVAGTTVEVLPATVRLVLICVPDDAIVDVAQDLADCDHPWSETVVGHTSGATRAAVLDPVGQEGAATMSVHPMQTFTPETSPEALKGIVVGVEGEDRAVDVGVALAEALGARPVRLTPDEKARYHCAGVLASNGLVALMGVVEEVMGADDESFPDRGADLIGPLVEQTWSNLKRDRPENVLTGPVMRGDLDTVQAHLEALRDETPHLIPVYTALSTEMVRLAVRGGHLSADRAETLLTALRTAADAVADAENGPVFLR